jgi:hypothetical protein
MRQSQRALLPLACPLPATGPSVLVLPPAETLAPLRGGADFFGPNATTGCMHSFTAAIASRSRCFDSFACSNVRAIMFCRPVAHPPRRAHTPPSGKQKPLLRRGQVICILLPLELTSCISSCCTRVSRAR